jgi:CheY-like chemotaxis protein
MADHVVPFDQLSVMIVEDQNFMVEIVRDILRQNGCRSAVEYLEFADISLVLCDIKMQPLNGLQFLAAVRSGLTDAPVDLPVIMLTALAEDPMIAAARALSANGFLAKPVSASDLTTEINRVFATPSPFEPPAVDKHAVYTAIEAARVQLREQERALGLDLIRQKPATARKRGDGWILIEEVAPGMVLADDIVSLRGQKLLSLGTELNANHVRLLQRDGPQMGVTAIKVRG